ncbi:hypothetical protein CDO52_14360 [Nocardiopsis gilva YIM 90087]|uniref:YdbS-like PH domain-containing protein n=1 Tax=Nocardiopsis gilva YIM 90087 TaxID=1235441 RepID=A0A223S6Q3_9ACTN|nr:PH domain-containing protein [Nocardiopsis gilva]ASU83806.1 hypothetical protein CDO52_14360 [Nocardiopsis gilva YIM 90087]
MTTGTPGTPVPCRNDATNVPAGPEGAADPTLGTPRVGTAAGAARTSADGPAAIDPGWRALSPLTVWILAVILAVFVGLPALVATVVVAAIDGLLPWAVLILPATVLLIAGLVGVDALRLRLTRYRVTDERMEMYTGIVAKSYRSIPRERIRSVDVNAPLWARPFGLCGVVIGTGQHVGSAQSDELRLDFVAAHEGDRLRRELLLRDTAGGRRAAGSQAAGAEAVDAAESTELARLQPAWIGYAALTWHSVALGAGALGSVFGVLGWLSPERAALIPFLPPTFAQDLYEFVLARLTLAIPLALLFGLVTGAIAAIALHVEAWWNYQLSREADDTLRVRRGLLNLKSLAIEERRLRGVEVSEPLPQRWFGAADVSAVATGLADRKDAPVSKSALSPDMPRAEALRVAGAVAREAGSPTDMPLAAHPRAALRRRLNRAVGAALVLIAAAAVPSWFLDGWPVWVPVVVAFATAPLLVMYAVGCYRGLGHTVGERHLVVRKGMAARATVALQREAVIGWTISRSPFQRRLGLATVGATTAAGEGVYTAPDMDLGAGLEFADGAVPGLLTPFLERV